MISKVSNLLHCFNSYAYYTIDYFITVVGLKSKKSILDFLINNNISLFYLNDDKQIIICDNIKSISKDINLFFIGRDFVKTYCLIFNISYSSIKKDNLLYHTKNRIIYNNCIIHLDDKYIDNLDNFEIIDANFDDYNCYSDALHPEECSKCGIYDRIKKTDFKLKSLDNISAFNCFSRKDFNNCGLLSAVDNHYKHIDKYFNYSIVKKNGSRFDIDLSTSKRKKLYYKQLKRFNDDLDSIINNN